MVGWWWWWWRLGVRCCDRRSYWCSNAVLATCVSTELSTVEQYGQPNCHTGHRRSVRGGGHTGLLLRLITVAAEHDNLISAQCTLMPDILLLETGVHSQPTLYPARCSAIAERPRCTVRYSFRQKSKSGTRRP